MLLILSTVAMSFSINQSLPPVNYIKAIDIWFGACVMWICAALATSVALSKTDENSDEKTGHKKCGKWRLTIARVVFPVTFFVFIAIYFVLYV